jgi:hypothetical protein
MRASFSYHDIAPLMGPIMWRLLYGRHHHDRLVTVLPKMTRLQLVSDLHGPPDHGSTQSPDEICWSLLSLPAQHICQTVHDSRRFPKVARPLPSTITLHHSAANFRKASVLLPNIDFADDANGTICDVSIVFARPICTLPHHMNPVYVLHGDCIWDSIRAEVNEQLGPSIPSHTPHLKRLKFKIFGMVPQKATPYHYMCQCGDKAERSPTLLNKVRYMMLKTRGGYRIPYNVEFGPLDEAPTCMACGEK